MVDRGVDGVSGQVRNGEGGCGEMELMIRWEGEIKDGVITGFDSRRSAMSVPGEAAEKPTGGDRGRSVFLPIHTISQVNGTATLKR